MKQFLAILLIAAITCVEVSKPLDYTEIELNIFKKIGNGIKKVVNGVKNFVSNAWNAVQKGINWLKQKGLWDHVKTLLKTAGKAAATAACSAALSPAVCAPVINFLL